MRHYPYVPQPALLRRVQAAISHGGHKTVMEGLAAGVPYGQKTHLRKLKEEVSQGGCPRPDLGEPQSVTNTDSVG